MVHLPQTEPNKIPTDPTTGTPIRQIHLRQYCSTRTLEGESNNLPQVKFGQPDQHTAYLIRIRVRGRQSRRRIPSFRSSPTWLFPRPSIHGQGSNCTRSSTSSTALHKPITVYVNSGSSCSKGGNINRLPNGDQMTPNGSMGFLPRQRARQSQTSHLPGQCIIK